MEVLTVREMSEYLGVSVSTCYRILKRGEISYYKKSFGYRINKDDLKQYLETDKTHRVLSGHFEKAIMTPVIINRLGGVIDAMAKAKSKRLAYGFGSVRQRKPGGRWSIDYVDHRRNGKNGKPLRIQKYVDADTKEEAIEVLQKTVIDVRVRTGELKRENIGFREFAQIFKTDYMSSRRNWKTDSYRLETLIGFFEDKDLRQITPLMIERFRTSRLNKGNSKSTVNRYTQLLKRLLNVAIEEGLLETNPANKVKLFSEKDRQVERILLPHEERKLLEVSTGHLRSMLVIALNTGMRRGEILNLMWSQVDMMTRTIKVEQTKSAKVRFLPVNSNLFEELTKLKTQSGQNSYVFMNPKTGKPYTTIRRSFETACRNAEITGFRFHDARHHFASVLVRKGCDIETVRELLGHSELSLTQRYVHAQDAQKRRAVELLIEPKSDNNVTRSQSVKWELPATSCFSVN